MPTKLEEKQAAEFFRFRDRKERGPFERKLISLLRRYHSIMPNYLGVMCHVFLGNGTGIEWRGNRLTLDASGEAQLTQGYADRIWGVSTYDHAPIPYHVAWAPLFNIPDGASKEIKLLAQEFAWILLSIKETDYRDKVQARLVEYKRRNPVHFKDETQRRMHDLRAVQKATREAALRYGWTWLLH